MKFIAVILFLFSVALSANAQSEEQKKLESNFRIYYCDCLEKISNENPEAVLYLKAEPCVLNFHIENEKTIESILKEDRKSDVSIADRRKRLTNAIVINSVDALADECKYYRQTLQEFKEIILKQLGALNNPEDISLFVEELKSTEGDIRDVKNMTKFYLMIGVLYDEIHDNANARKYYQKSIDQNPTSEAKGLLKLNSKNP